MKHFNECKDDFSFTIRLKKENKLEKMHKKVVLEAKKRSAFKQILL